MAQLESGAYRPSLSTLYRISQVLGTRLENPLAPVGISKRCLCLPETRKLTAAEHRRTHGPGARRAEYRLSRSVWAPWWRFTARHPTVLDACYVTSELLSRLELHQ